MLISDKGHVIGFIFWVLSTDIYKEKDYFTFDTDFRGETFSN